MHDCRAFIDWPPTLFHALRTLCLAIEAKLSSFEPTSEGAAPIVIFDADAEELPMAVFSPVNYPKAQHVTAAADYFGAGVKAKVLVTPAGWTQTYMLSAGHGINSGMMAWGDRMLTFTGKKRADMYVSLLLLLRHFFVICIPRLIFYHAENRYLDQTHSTIGFWTDNGAISQYYAELKTCFVDSAHCISSPRIGRSPLCNIAYTHARWLLPLFNWQKQIGNL